MYASFGYMNASYDAVEVIHYGDLTVFRKAKSLVVPVVVKSGERVLSEIEIMPILAKHLTFPYFFSIDPIQNKLSNWLRGVP